MADMLYRAIKYMNVADVLIAWVGRPKKQEKHDDPRPERGRKVARTSDRRDERRSRPPSRQTTNFTPLNAPLNQVIMQIRDDPALAWLGKLKADPNKRPKNKYCRFHRDHRHETSDCYNLKQQIGAFIRQGKLRQFIGWERAGEKLPRD